MSYLVKVVVASLFNRAFLSSALSLFSFFLAFNCVNAQNLITNGNFESYSSCPNSYSQINRATNWYNANVSGAIYPSCDYFNCGYQFIGNPYPTPSGTGAAGMNYAATNETAAEMLGTFVSLTAGQSYNFSIKLSLAFVFSTSGLPPFSVMVGNTSSFPVNTTSSPYPYCPTGFTTVGSISAAQILTLDTGSYTTFSFTFTAPSNTNAMILGGVCNSTANYYVFVDDVSVTVACNGSTIPSSVSTVVNCPGASRILTVNGGSLGTGASWKWYTGSCSGTLVGTGSSITVNPTSTTTYYVRAEGTCGTTGCRSSTVVIPSYSAIYTWDGSQNSNWHEPCNWNTNRVPNGNSDVIIPGGTPNNPSINAGQSAFCSTLQINYSNGGALSVNSAQGASLQVFN